MAGRVRQPIDIPALERYIETNLPLIKTPLDLKQVRPFLSHPLPSVHLLTSARMICIVRFRSVESNVLTHGGRWPEVRLAQEATGQTSVQDRPSGGAGIPHHSCARVDRCPSPQGVYLM